MIWDQITTINFTVRINDHINGGTSSESTNDGELSLSLTRRLLFEINPPLAGFVLASLTIWLKSILFEFKVGSTSK